MRDSPANQWKQTRCFPWFVDTGVIRPAGGRLVLMACADDEGWQRRLALRERCEYPREPITDPFGPHWVPTYVPARTMPQNVYSLARPVFGKTMAEWALPLAEDVVNAMPEVSTCAVAPEWRRPSSDVPP